jgi:hypothetical protein
MFSKIKIQEVVTSILEQWNAGDKKGAVGMLLLVKYMMPKAIFDYLANKMIESDPDNITPWIREALSTFGGTVETADGKIYDVHSKIKKEDAEGSGSPKDNLRLFEEVRTDGLA